MRIKNNNLKLAKYQEDFLYDPARFTITEASTKTGKTFSHLYWLFEMSHGKNPQWYTDSVEPGWWFWWVAPVFGQAEIAYRRLKNKLQGFNKYKFNESKLFIETPVKTLIGFKSADKPDSLYGEDVYAAVFDEFTRAKQSAWFALRSTLTATKGPCKFIGNYTGSMNWGHKLSVKAKIDPDYSYHRVTAYDAVRAGILDEKEVEQARSDLPIAVFKSLYLAEGSAEDDILFAEGPLESLFTNKHVKVVNRRFITADVALHGSDRFIITVWDGWRIIDIIKVDKCEADEATKIIKDVAEKYKVPRHRIVFDGDGLGAFLRGYLRGANAFVNNSAPSPEKGKKEKINYENLKAQCAYLLAQKIKDGEIYIESEEYKEDIQRELEAHKKVESPGGKFGITKKKDVKELLGYSPDFADALFMRMFFELKISGSLSFAR